MIPVERLRATIRLLWPDEITPTGKRVLEQLCEVHERGDDYCDVEPVVMGNLSTAIQAMPHPYAKET